MADRLPTRHDPLTAVHQTTVHLEGLILPDGPQRPEQYGYVSYPTDRFLTGLAACGEPGRLLDLGCGIGTKLLIAYFAGWSVTGVESHLPYLQVADRLVGSMGELVHADAFEFDCSGYEVIYTYLLCKTHDRQRSLIDRIAATATPGTFLFSAGWPSHVGEQVADEVWRL